MEICDPEKQDKYFSQPSNSKLLDEISDFPLSFIGLSEKKNKRFSLFGASILTFAILCGSSIGPVSNMYGDVNPFLKNIWRCQLSFILSAPFVIYALKHNSRAFDFEYITTVSSSSGIITMIISGLFLTGALVTFIASSWLTIASHTYVLHSLSGVIIILYKVLSNMNVHFLEKAGSLAVIVGAVFLLCDPNVKKIGDQQTSILGEILAIICA